jgi:multiple sugar transport system ATP-binding protein
MNIELINITRKFKDTVAVEQLSTRFEEGKLSALLGPSGCGKSTLLNMISGILPPSDGRVLFDGKDVTDLPPEKRGVGFVFQNYALYPHMSVSENISFPMELQRIPKAERAKSIKELSELVQISDLLNRKPSQLSGGQQQRVAVARALAKRPNILLLDEPLSNLDARLRLEMREEIRRIQKTTGITTIFVTHDQEEAMSISDQILILKKGRLQQYGNPQYLYEHPANTFVADFMGSPRINFLHGEYYNHTLQMNHQIIRLPFKTQFDNRKKVILGIRSEAFTLTQEKEASLQAKVTNVFITGKDELIHIDIDDQDVRAYISSDHEIKAGNVLNLGFRKKGIFLFDEESGELIGDLKDER